MKDIIELLSGKIMTAVSGIFIVLSFVLSLSGREFFVDPAWISVIISGIPLVYKAIKKLIYNKGVSKISSALLITIAMISAVLTGDLFAAAEVAFIMAIGEILEDVTTDRAKKGLKKLIALAPQQGRIIENGTEKMVDVQEIKEGDILRILPGEAIPVDGRVVSGETSVDQSVITGESLPVDKKEGDEVYCGTINKFGAIDVVATRVSEDSSLARLIRMVKEADEKKAPMQRTADKWASLLVPVALLIAIITFFVTNNITRAVTVLVVFCPCALVLATPTAIMAAIGQATKRGVIIKSGETLEKMGRVDTAVFDKTGTLTLGKLTVSDILPMSSKYSEKDVIMVAATAEMKSEHPLGRAICEFAKDLEIPPPDEFKMSAGKGVFALVNDKEILCGNEGFIKEKGIKISDEMAETLSMLRKEGKATVVVYLNREEVGIIGLSDVLKEEAKNVVEKLLSIKTTAVLLTGDNKGAAKYVADKVKIEQVFAELLPEHKVDVILKMQKENKKVCMIGDGVNDAPALKTADVGIAMGTIGSDIAVEAADIALMGDDISCIPYLKKLGVITLKTIKFSISLSLIINLLAVVLSMLGMLTPTTGALVHNAGSVFVIFIAALLYDRKI